MSNAFDPPSDQHPATLETNSDARMWGMLCHLASLGTYVLPVAGGILGPVIVWSLKKSEYPFVDDQGKESINFQITMNLVFLITLATLCVGIGFFILPVIPIINTVFMAIACVKANQGEYYRYPFNWRFIK